MKPQEKTFIIVGTSAILIAAGLGGSYLFFAKDAATSTPGVATSASASTGTGSSEVATTPSTPTSASSTNTSSTTTATSSGYKDGTYSATSNYSVPQGNSNSIGVSITVKDGVVTAVKTDENYSDRESEMYIDSFESLLQNAVVDKSIKNLQLNRIGGATLTTAAFDDALDSIRNDAKA